MEFACSYCSTKWANQSGLECLDVASQAVERHGFSELCGRGGKFRGGELFGVTTPLEEILSGT